MNLTLCKTKKPGCCPVKYCRKKPRDLYTRPNSTQLCGSHAKELWRLKNPVHAAYDLIRAHARKRKIVFTLTLAHFTEVIAPTRYLDESGSERHHLHIDRIQNHLGYEDGNIRVLTCSANVSKGNVERRQKYVDAKIRGHVAAKQEASDADDSDLEYTPPAEGEAF